MALLDARKIRGRADDDAGFILVEVIVSAALLVLVSLAVFTTLDQGDKLASQQVRRAMAANVAQAEMERIRSLPIEDVANLNDPTDFVDPAYPKIKYTITPTSRWVTDGGDTPVCATRGGGLDYMRLTVKVSWTGMGSNVKPVTFSTVVTPASRASSSTAGSLSVNVLRADGVTGVTGLAISLVPTAAGRTFTETTNANGCVVFPFVPATTYDLRFSRTGWVNQNSVGPVDDRVTVAAGQTTKTEYLYDLGGFTKTTFFVSRSGRSDAPSTPLGIVLYNGDQTSGVVTEAMSGTTPAWDTGRPLFPSQFPYAIYAGSCDTNRPPSPTNVNIAPGQPQNAGPTRVASYDIRVLNGSSAANSTEAVNDATVNFFSFCGATYVRRTVALNRTNLGDATQGRLQDPGFPYAAAASFCVSGVVSGQRYWQSRAGVANTNMTSTPPIQPLYLRATTRNGTTMDYGTGACPNT